MSEPGGIVFVVQCAAFSSSHLSLTAWLVRHPISRICDYPHKNGFSWFVWCLCSLPKTFRSLHSSHAQGWEITLLLGSGWLRLIGACSVGARSHHVRLLFSLAHKFFSKTAPIVGSKLGRSFTVDVNEPKPNRPNTMNLVKKWAQELGLSEGFFSSLTRP